jgi:hypothetical protein
MDSLPLDMQRIITQYWELEYKNKNLIAEAQYVKRCGDGLCIDGIGSHKERLKWICKLQQVLASLKEIGDEKLELTSQLLDIAEGYGQQLSLVEKEVDSCRTRDELMRSNISSVSQGYKHSSSVSSTEFTEKKKERHQHKRTRNTIPEQQVEDDTLSNNGSTLSEAPAVTTTTNTATTIKPPKRGKETKPKKNNRATGTSAGASKDQGTSAAPLIPAGVVVPQPDFNSEPIGPDEPTYCLCDQVSFGEMIGCDNEDCPIEWFHFVCVGLTSKPKGRWYCPQCSKQRSRHRSSK